MTLAASNLTVAYNRVPVLHHVSLSLGSEEIVAILGGNAAGKSTTLKAILGLVPLRQGTVELDGRSITRLPPHEVVAAGVAIVPENRRLFPRLSVRQNLVLGAWAADQRTVPERIKEVCSHLPFVATVLDRAAGTLSGGEQQQVALARALVSRPRYLLLDEPSMGLAPALVDQSFELLCDLRRLGIGVLVVEQNTERALAVADRAYVLREGRVTLDGKAADLRRDPGVVAAFLGLDPPSAGLEAS